MDSVKATMKPERNSCELGKSPQFEFIHSKRIHLSKKIRSKGIQYSGTVDTKPPLSCVGMQDANSMDHGFEGSCTIMRPDITTLMASTCTAPKIETPEEVLPEVLHVRYMTGPSFNSLLTRLEMVINEMGGDLAL